MYHGFPMYASSYVARVSTPTPLLRPNPTRNFDKENNFSTKIHKRTTSMSDAYPPQFFHDHSKNPLYNQPLGHSHMSYTSAHQSSYQSSHSGPHQYAPCRPNTSNSPFEYGHSTRGVDENSDPYRL